MTILNCQNMSIKPHSAWDEPCSHCLHSDPRRWMLVDLCWPSQGVEFSPEPILMDAGVWKAGGNASLHRLFLREAAGLGSILGKWRKDMNRNSRHFPNMLPGASHCSVAPWIFSNRPLQALLYDLYLENLKIWYLESLCSLFPMSQSGFTSEHRFHLDVKLQMSLSTDNDILLS